MTDRTLYTGIRPANAQAPPAQRNRRVEQMGGPHGRGASRARVDEVEARLQRLGQILDAGDWQALQAWRLSQLAALGFIKIQREPEPEQKPSGKNGSRLKGTKKVSRTARTGKQCLQVADS